MVLGVLRGYAFYFHIHTLRFNPYTTESVTNEMASKTSAVTLAPE